MMTNDVEQSNIDPLGIAAQPVVQQLIRMALDEDVGSGDVTSQVLVPDRTAQGWIVARGNYVAAGAPVAEAVFAAVDPALEVRTRVPDGEAVEPGTRLMEIHGPAGSLLTAERTALNFYQRLCGIASTTRSYVEAVEGTDVQLLDTRKTTPGYRLLEKYAVACGGGSNHRMGLYDRVMIKDNHLAHWTASTGKGIREAVECAARAHPELLIQVEADTIAQVEAVLPAQPDWILLDNMSLDELELCVSLCKGLCKTEASGGVTLDTVAGIARTGVDAISVGALTHSFTSADLGMDFEGV